jgi:hypothetical protein
MAQSAGKQSREPTLPPATPELVLVFAKSAISAYLRTNRRKKGEDFLSAMADDLLSEESLANVLRIDNQSENAAWAEGRRGAIAHFRVMLPVLVAKLK